MVYSHYQTWHTCMEVVSLNCGASIPIACLAWWLLFWTEAIMSMMRVYKWQWKKARGEIIGKFNWKMMCQVRHGIVLCKGGGILESRCCIVNLSTQKNHQSSCMAFECILSPRYLFRAHCSDHGELSHTSLTFFRWRESVWHVCPEVPVIVVAWYCPGWVDSIFNLLFSSRGEEGMLSDPPFFPVLS